MSIAESSIRNKTVSWMVIVLLIIGGYISFQGLGRLEDPNFTIKQAVIVVQYPGASAQEVEEEVTKQALNEFERQAQVAYDLVRTGEKSPLYYHMFAQRMDLMVLAQSVGWFQWRVKRHFSPSVFAKLSSAKLSAYSDALGISVKQLTKLPNLSNKNK